MDFNPKIAFVEKWKGVEDTDNAKGKKEERKGNWIEEKLKEVKGRGGKKRKKKGNEERKKGRGKWHCLISKFLDYYINF